MNVPMSNTSTVPERWAIDEGEAVGEAEEAVAPAVHGAAARAVSGESARSERVPAPVRGAVSLIVPARNEAANIGWVLNRIPDCVDEVILVDGESTDATLEMARATLPSLRIVPQQGPGKGSALRTGFLAAKGEYIVMIDADGSMSPQEIPRYLHFLESGFDLVEGLALPPAAAAHWTSTMLRRLGNRGLLALMNVMYQLAHRPLLRLRRLQPQRPGPARPPVLRLRDRDRDHRPGAAGRAPGGRGAHLGTPAPHRPVQPEDLPRRAPGAAHPAARAQRAAHGGRPVKQTTVRPSPGATAAPGPPLRLNPDQAPIDVAELELGDGSGAPELLRVGGPGPVPPGHVLALVRVGGRPVGMVQALVGPEDEPARLLAATARRELGAALEPEAAPEAAPAEPYAPLATIVIATRERPDRLACCLESVEALRYPRLEVVVVDNDPVTYVTAELIKERYADRVRYVREPVRGLAAAHNRGVAEALGEIIAFTDDDVVIDPRWLTALAAGFTGADGRSDPRIGCVTGLILPAELRTRTQVMLEAHGGFTKGFHRRLAARPAAGRRAAVPLHRRTLRLRRQHGLPYRGAARPRRLRPCRRHRHPRQGRRRPARLLPDRGQRAPPESTSRRPWSGTTTGSARRTWTTRPTATGPASAPI